MTRQTIYQTFNKTNSAINNLIVKEEEVKHVLKCLKLGKASGHDTISHHIEILCR